MMWIVGLVVATAVVTLLAMQVGVRRALLHEMDGFLLESVAELGSLLESESLEAVIQVETAADKIRQQRRQRFVEVLSADGTSLWSSRGSDFAALSGLPLNDLRPTSMAGFRVVQKQVRGNKGELFVARVGIPLDLIDTDVARVDALALTLAAVVLVVAPLIGYWLAGRAVRVLGDLIDRTARLRPAQLVDRLPLRGAGDELDQLANTINGLLDRLASHLSRREDFVANAAHELRTPVAAIRATAEVALNSERSKSEYESLLEDVIEECSALELLVGQLLLLSESDADRLRIHGERVPLDEVVRQSAAMFSPVAELSEIALQVHTAPAFVEGNRPHLKQLVNNLLDNALQHTPRGGTIRVELEVDDAAEKTRLTVSDSGTGIAAHDLPHIFERFYRGDKSRSYTSANRGTGLGLSICQTIVEAHAGSISAESLAEEGAVFTVELPLAVESLRLAPHATMHG